MKLLFCVLVGAFAFSAALAKLSSKEQSIVDFALTDMGTGYYVIRVKSVETQVVAGTMYHVKAKVGYQIPGGIGKKYDCYIKVWERPHGFKTVEESTCT